MSLLPGKFYLDDFFDDFALPKMPKMELMKTDVYEKDGNIHIEMDVPGFDKNDIKINRDNSISSNTLILSGTVARPTCITIPVNDLKKYFEVQLALALQNKNIYLKEPLTEGALEPFDKPEFEITHDILIAFEDVLKNSNNMVSETLFKLAGAKYCQIATGTDYAGIKMFNDFCVKNKIDNSRIRMVDSSGVSKNNLVYTDFVTDFLIANKDNKVMTYLPTSGEGTLALRLLPLKNNLQEEYYEIC